MSRWLHCKSMISEKARVYKSVGGSRKEYDWCSKEISRRQSGLLHSRSCEKIHEGKRQTSGVGEYTNANFICANIHRPSTKMINGNCSPNINFGCERRKRATLHILSGSKVGVSRTVARFSLSESPFSVAS
mmetsp:Transcript_39297/g.118201  ORF Transcript_39297/g.118201 Transcript_39297/m.118201 type:complete len:131 (+) Transcript_39297:654-1046(+)